MSTAQCSGELRPLSEVLIDFASPFFPLAWRRGPSASVQSILDFAAAVWNAVNEGATAESLIAQVCEQPSAPMNEMTHALVRRKQLFFANDTRMMPWSPMA